MLHANIIAWSDRLDTPGRPWGTTTPVQLWACVKVAPPKHVGFPFWLPSNSQTNLRRVTTLKNKHTHTYVDMSFVALQSANCRSSGICNGSCIQTRTFMIRRLFMGWLRRAWGRQGTLARNHPIPVFRREVGVSFSGGGPQNGGCLLGSSQKDTPEWALSLIACSELALKCVCVCFPF